MPATESPPASIRERLVDDLYRSMLPFAALTIIGGLLRDYLVEIPGSSWIPGAMMIALATIHLLRSRIGYRTRATLLLAALQIASLSGMARYGIGAPSIFLLPASVVVAWLVLEFRASLVAASTACTVFLMAASMNVAFDPTGGRLAEYNRRPEFWLQIAMVTSLCGALILVAARLLLLDLLRKQQELTAINGELEERILRRTQRLERSRRDLQAFSFAVSHDLQTPLRAVDGYAKLLQEESAPRWNPDEAESLSRILAGTKRMGEIIDTLLGMASLEREALDLEPVDLRTQVLELAQELDHDARSRGLTPPKWVIPDMPPCRTDLFLMRQILTNLMSNAAKFSRAFTKTPVVELGFERRIDGLWISVKDNGPGLDPSRSDRLFRMFSREYGSEVEGKGIGLATVKRILDRLDGAIEVGSAPGNGATFRFRPAPDERGQGEDPAIAPP